MKSARSTTAFATIVTTSLVLLQNAWSQGGVTGSSDIRVQLSDTRSFVVEFRPRFREQRFAGPDGREFIRLDFDGAIRDGREGSADLGSRLISVALPSAAGNTVGIVSADYEDLPGVDIAPVPRYRDKDGMPVAFAYDPSDEYRRSVLDPSKDAELLPPVRSRSVTIGRVKIGPVQYDAVWTRHQAT